ncbi:MAG: hypothetical protein VX223_10100, partial [Myxococcota bacterium]|nr:hypothetical protein [Myxococcota bacterium]
MPGPEHISASGLATYEASDLLDHVSGKLQQTAQDTVSWFCEQLPHTYFESTDQAAVERHLEAIIGARASGQPVSVVLKNDDSTIWTFIQETDRTGLLVSLLDQLPRDRRLASANVFTARDGSLVVDVFQFAGDESPASLTPKIAERMASLAGDTDTSVQVTPNDDATCDIILVAGGVTARRLLDRGAGYLAALAVPIVGAHLFTSGTTTAVSFSVGVPADTFNQMQVTHDLRRLAWADERAYALSTQANEYVSLVHAEVWVALCDLSFHALSVEDPYRFSRGRVFSLALKAKERLQEVGDAVIHGHTLTSEPVQHLSQRLDGDALTVLRTIIRAGGAIQHHNLRATGRFGLALRLDPAFLHSASRCEKAVPYATVFFSLDGGMGFHVRFRDIARGGLRVVRPRTVDAHVHESERLYDECWGLAFAQQLKNKDIPEGGSKGVMLAEPGAEVDRLVKAVGDGIIDLCIASDPHALTDRIFLGPDENITDEMIVWLVDRAASRGY